MKKVLSLFTVCIVLFSNLGIAAEDVDHRACNLQGREIALRVSEEVSTSMSAAERNHIAAIAEEVCLDFVTAVAAPVRNEIPVISRPAAPTATASAPVAATPETGARAAATEEEKEQDKGLFGNLRIIDSEDRVKRPGLKRP